MPIYKNGPRGDTSIYYEQSGQGYPLLLLPPGGLNATIGFWQGSSFNAPEVFKRWFHVVAIDERNAGSSSGPLDMDDPWGSFARDHIGLMNHLGFERFHVMGCCIGCSHALKLASIAPSRVSSLVLQQPVGLDDNNRQSLPNAWKLWAEGMRKSRPEVQPAALEAYGRKMWGGDFVLSASRDWLKTCQIPMLVLPGIDEAHPTSIGREVATLAPNAEKLEPWKEPADLTPSVVQHIRAFLDKNTPLKH